VWVGRLPKPRDLRELVSYPMAPTHVDIAHLAPFECTRTEGNEGGSLILRSFRRDGPTPFQIGVVADLMGQAALCFEECARQESVLTITIWIERPRKLHDSPKKSATLGLGWQRAGAVPRRSIAEARYCLSAALNDSGDVPMGMTPAEYVGEIVVPTVREFGESRRSRQRAYLACIVTFHIKDHLKRAGATQIERTMRTACNDEFELVRSICNGSKHLEADTSHAIPFVAGLDYDRPPHEQGLPGRAAR
jgi:hypothetical protein